MTEFDYIVVAGGSAGRVLAARLSEDPGVGVLTGGPMKVAPAADPHPVADAFLEATAESGHARASDISGGLEEGFGRVDLNIVDGARQSAADAYLRPALEAPELHFCTEVQKYDGHSRRNR